MNHIPKFHATFTRIQTTDGPVPPPRTSHSCVPYKNRYLIVIGGENEEQSAEGDSKLSGDDVDESELPKEADKIDKASNGFEPQGVTSTLIKTD